MSEGPVGKDMGFFFLVDLNFSVIRATGSGSKFSSSHLIRPLANFLLCIRFENPCTRHSRQVAQRQIDAIATIQTSILTA